MSKAKKKKQFKKHFSRFLIVKTFYHRVILWYPFVWHSGKSMELMQIEYFMINIVRSSVRPECL